MKKLEISKETICQLGREKGIIEICDFKIVCQDSNEDARRDYVITIDGFDCNHKRKKVFFDLTEWEEIVDGDNQT